MHVVHENKNYKVIVNDDGTGYLLYNKETGVDEEEFKSLPNAIGIAEQCDVYLDKQLWQWVRKSEEGETEEVADVLTH